MTAGDRSAHQASVHEARRRREVALAGHGGDPEGVRRFLHDPSPEVRATALTALARLGAAGPADLDTMLSDADPRVRRRACDVAVGVAGVDLVPVLGDDDPSVVEVAAWALGERGEGNADAVAALALVATEHDDPLGREAAVAALGALGDPAGLHAILAALADKPAVRRRAVIALAPFDGPEVDAALRRALDDRDWQVRQVAEDLLNAGRRSALAEESQRQ